MSFYVLQNYQIWEDFVNSCSFIEFFRSIIDQVLSVVQSGICPSCISVWFKLNPAKISLLPDCVHRCNDTPYSVRIRSERIIFPWRHLTWKIEIKKQNVSILKSHHTQRNSSLNRLIIRHYFPHPQQRVCVRHEACMYYNANAYQQSVPQWIKLSSPQSTSINAESAAFICRFVCVALMHTVGGIYTKHTNTHTHTEKLTHCHQSSSCGRRVRHRNLMNNSMRSLRLIIMKRNGILAAGEPLEIDWNWMGSIFCSVDLTGWISPPRFALSFGILDRWPAIVSIPDTQYRRKRSRENQ